MNGHNASAPDPGLSADERAEIEGMYARLGGSYYDILGVPRGCDQGALRAAYGSLCGRFHPELFDGLELGRYRTYVDAIFREITNAYEVLCKPDSRAIYDQSLPAPRAGRTIAQIPAEPPPAPPPREVAPSGRPVAAAVISVGGTVSQSGPVPRMDAPPGTRSSSPTGIPRSQTPPAGSVAPPPPAAPPPEATPFKSPGPVIPVPGTLKRTPTAALTNGGLTGTLKRTPPPDLGPSPGAIPSMRATPSPDSETTKSSLERLRAQTILTQKRKQREDLDASIEAATKRGDNRELVRLLKHALTIDADDPALQRRLALAEAATDATSLERISQQAKAAERSDRWEAAAALWTQAATQCPGEYSFHLYAAQAYCEAGVELPRAADLARRAMRLRPEAVEAQVCLARAFFKAGRVASAKSAIEGALRLAPQNPAVLDLARQLRV